MRDIKRKLHYVRPYLVYSLFAEKDKNILELLKEQTAQNYYRKYVNRYLECHSESEIENYSERFISNSKQNKNMFIYWKQGLDSCPPIVRKCIETSTKAFGREGWECQILDFKSVKELCDIPDFIYEKYNSGHVSDAHFSDLVRLQLLNRYGGVWLDSTVYIDSRGGINRLPQYLYEPFFVYQNIMRGNKYILLSNWLISSAPGNPLLEATYDVLVDYWKHENSFFQYYGFHIIFSMLTEYYAKICIIVHR